MEILNNCMLERKGKCRDCGKIGFVSDSEEYWHEGLCYDCMLKEMSEH